MLTRPLFFALVASISLGAADIAASAEPNSKPKLIPLDIAPGGVFMTIDAPAGIRVSPSSSFAKMQWGKTGVFIVRELEPRTLEDEVAGFKKRYSGATVKVLVDTKDTYVAGSPALGDDTFEVYVQLQADGKHWLCYTEHGLTEGEARLAAQAAKTLRRTPANSKAEQAFTAAVAKLKELDCRFKPAFNHLELSGEIVQDADLAILKHIPQIDWVIVENAPKLTPQGFRQVLASLPNVASVTLQGENITDAWLEHLSTVPHLERVWLRETSLTAKAWPHLAKVSGLKELKVRNTSIKDAALKHLAPLKNLDEIELRGMTLNDAGLEHLAEVKELDLLDLSNSFIDDAALAKLHNAKQVSTIRLGNTKVTPVGIAKLKAALPKVEIETD